MQIKANDFDLLSTIESGQIFGFEKLSNNIYELMVGNSVIKIRQTKDRLYVDSKSEENLLQAVRTYFSLDKDLDPLYSIMGKDRVLKPLLKLKGLRIITQDPWIALGSFIISSNNNIKRIKSIWKNLAENIEKNRYLFPGVKKLAFSSETFLRKQGLGFRAPYLIKTAKVIHEDLDFIPSINRLSYSEAKEKLMTLSGVGAKIADCVLLFGFQRMEAFPIDVWINRMISKLYFNNREITKDEMMDFACKNWGVWAGYVQQYIYHGARNNLI